MMNARTKERMSFSRVGTLATSADGSSELWASESTAARHRCGVVRVAREALHRLGPCSERRTVHPRQRPTPVPQAALGHAEAQGRRAGSEEARERPWSEQQDSDGDGRRRDAATLDGGHLVDGQSARLSYVCRRISTTVVGGRAMFADLRQRRRPRSMRSLPSSARSFLRTRATSWGS